MNTTGKVIPSRKLLSVSCVKYRICTALLHAVSTLANIHIIDQKYLVSGHTQMGCDSVHAAIENAKRNTSIVSMIQ